MPARIPNACSPNHLAAHLVRRGKYIRLAGSRIARGGADIDGIRQCGIHVIHIDLAVLTAGVNVTRIGAPRWRKVTADQSLENTVAAESHDRAVVFVGLEVVVRVGLEAVVEAGRVPVEVDVVEVGRGHHSSQVPELHRLVFAVRKDVSTVAFAVYVCETFGVAHEYACFTAIAHGASVPDA